MADVVLKILKTENIYNDEDKIFTLDNVLPKDNKSRGFDLFLAILPNILSKSDDFFKINLISKFY